MARLSQPAHSVYPTPTAGRGVDAVTGSTTAMSSPPLRALSLEASLQSHGNDSLPHSPRRRGSGLSTLSPADCRALRKILRDVCDSSPPSTPSRLEPSEQLCAKTDLTISTVDGIAADEDCALAGNEATDTGYEDEDDSMELSDGVEEATARDAMDVPGHHASQSLLVSNANHRLQASVSAHDKKDGRRYGDGRSLSAKYSKAKRQERNHTDPIVAKEGDSIEGNDSDCQPIPDDIKQLNLMRLSMEKVLDNERVKQERASREREPGIVVSDHSVKHHHAITTIQQQSVHEASDADNEDNDATDEATIVRRS
ncbi:hypothetical protein N0V95_002250 [Ascochyta clinopodiicola]|nr:hypothetical protein N0V95_002250 [Ascochyta clinopodiicola]